MAKDKSEKKEHKKRKELKEATEDALEADVSVAVTEVDDGERVR